MRTYQVVLLVLGSLALACDARPGYISAYHSGGANAYYNPVGGSSVVNVFPAGYAYQTVLDDGSISHVVFVSGPESQHYLQQLLRSPHPFGPTRSVGVKYVQQTDAANAASAPSGLSAVSGPSSASGPSAFDQFSPEEAVNEVAAPATSAVSTSTKSLPAPTEAIPAVQSNSLFNFPAFPALRSFPVVSSYITNPFNSLMSYFGLPGMEMRGEPATAAAADGRAQAAANDDAQASNLSPVSTGVSASDAVAEVTTSASVAESRTSVVTEAAPTTPAAQDDEVTPQSESTSVAATQEPTTEAAQTNSEVTEAPAAAAAAVVTAATEAVTSEVAAPTEAVSVASEVAAPTEAVSVASEVAAPTEAVSATSEVAAPTEAVSAASEVAATEAVEAAASSNTTPAAAAAAMQAGETTPGESSTQSSTL